MKVLVIAPHADDEVLGVGGTIAKRAGEGHEIVVCVVTKGCEPLFREEYASGVQTECRKADAFLGVKETIFLDFPAAMLEEVPRYRLNDGILSVIREVKPDEVYIPHRGDMQIDHKMVTDAAMVALRPKYEHRVSRVYCYETLSETGWDIPNTENTFIPNVYEDLTDTIGRKLEALSFFQSQLSPFPAARSLGAVEALARFRGATVNVNAAEAFMLIREIK